MTDVTAQQFQQDVNDTSEWNNGDVNHTQTFRLGQTADSPAKLINDINTRGNAAIDELNRSRGFRVVGTFAAGFTYELPNDVGMDASGNHWILSNPDNLPFTVPAGTTPTSPVYQQASFADHNATVNRSAVGAHDDIYTRTRTLAQAISENATVGTRYKITDRGDGIFIVRTGLTANGRNIIQMNNGNQLELQIGMVLNFENWYASTESEQATALNALIQELSGPTIVEFGNSRYNFNARIVISNAKTAFRFGACTVNQSGYTWNGTQNPFGNLFNFTADNCGIIGAGRGATLFQLGVTDGNSVGWLHCDRGFISGVTLDGNKDNINAITDDSFQSGISYINSTGLNPTGEGHLHISDVEIRNFVQYGINLFGNRCRYVSVANADIHSNGNSDSESVGAGIVATRAPKHLSFVNVNSYSNKTRGYFISSAGENLLDISISGGSVYSNGLHGISITEEANLGSIAGQGSEGISISGVNIHNNTNHGILVGTYNNVGFIRNVSILGNNIYDNGQFGFLIQTNSGPTTTNVQFSTNTVQGNETGIGVGPGINTTVNVGGNICNGNTTNNYNISGTPTGVSVSFTPTVRGSATAGTATYNSQIGKYIIIDDIVRFDLLLDFTAFNGTGDLQVGGFPVAASSQEALSSEFCFVNAITATGAVVLTNLAGSTNAALTVSLNGASTNLPVQASGLIRCSGSYRIDL